MNETPKQDPTELPDIPEFLRREPVKTNDLPVEVIEETPVEVERQFVSIEESGGQEVTKE